MNQGTDVRVSWPGRGYALLMVLAYPRRFRRRYGVDSVAVFEQLHGDTRRRDGVRGVVRLWLRSIAQVLRGGWRERHGGPAVGSPRQPGRWPAHLARDVRDATRSLLRAPLFTVTAALILALGLGASTAIFSIVDTTLLRPLPYPQSERLVTVLWQWRPDGGGTDLSPVKADYWSRSMGVFDASTVISPGAGFNLMIGDEPTRAQGVRVSAGFFDTLGVQPSRGRGFSAAEDRPGGDDVLVVSDAFVRRVVPDGEDVLGRVVDINGAPHTIVGVMPPGFRFGAAELLVPLRLVPRSR